MAATQPSERAARAAGLDALDTAIRNHVMLALGQPVDPFRVVVRRLWEDHYRVNVLVGKDVTTTTIAHSYFLVADGDGKISRATPAIARTY
jgi:hypothetical protein